MSEEQKEKVIFADGLNIRKVNDFKFGISINTEKFIDFLNAFKNLKGYVNIDLCKAYEKESWYAKLNTWTPKPKEENQIKEVFEGDVIGDDEIPF